MAKNVKKRRKKKSNNILGPLVGLLFGSGVVAIMLALVLLIETVSRTGKINDSPLTDDGSKHYSADEEYINIDASSFTAYIGQSYNLTVSSNPMELAQAVMWSSSNEDAVIVDDNGVVRIVGEGVAAITATADKYSSAIAIEGVKSADSVSDMGFPSLDAMNGQKVNNTDNKTQTQTGSEQGGDSSETVTYPADSNNGSDNGYNNGTGNNYNGDSENTDAASAAEPDSETQNAAEETTTVYEVPATEPASPINTDEMFAVLSGSGFTQYLPNAAIYEVDDDYYGEVIVESDSVHIYIKKRSNEFDMAVRSALSYLLPDTADSVWNTYCTFTSDRTINSGGRKVRFVMPAANAHSQIIVYNP